MRGKSNAPLCENGDEEIGDLISMNNNFEEFNENGLENLPEIASDILHRSTEVIRLAVHPQPTHRSNGCEEFLENCSKKLLDQPLEAKFHFCSQIKENSKRKRTRSLHLSTRSESPFSCCSGASTPPDKRYDSFDELEELDAKDGFKRMRVTSSEVFSGRPENQDTNESFFEMGCSKASIPIEPVTDNCFKMTAREEQRIRLSLDEDDDSVEDISLNREDIAVNAHDILDEQRRQSTDVSRKLERRWLQSHFVETPENRDVKVQKRRKIQCLNDASDGHVISPMTTICSSNESKQNKALEYAFGIVHFNDVYEIDENKHEPVAGASRFASLVKEKIAEAIQKHGERPLVVFSGDCLNPSTLSCATQGWHMVEVLNEIGVDVAVFGNHEFDFGVDHAVKCVKEMNSTWLLANVVDKSTGRNLAEGLPSVMIERKNGLKIGIIGLVEEEWLDTLTTVNKSDLLFEDYVDVAQRHAKQLKEEGAKFVIAITHMRWPNDERLALLAPDVDLILGGHDHGYGVKVKDDCLIVKSGSDFRTFTTLDLQAWYGGCIDVKMMRYDITSTSAPPDKSVKDIVDRYVSCLERSFDECIGEIKTDLNGKHEDIRRQETTMGNFVADIMATVAKSDLVLINSGTFRSQEVHSSGKFLLRDLMNILPINDTLVTIRVTGQQLLDAFENGVSKYPRLEGRFPQVSGASFGFDPKADPGHRVVLETIRIGGKPLDLNRTYIMATKAYVARGRDGYTCLSKCPLMNDPDASPLLSTVVRNHIHNHTCLKKFEETNNCKMTISPDGKQINASRSDVDIAEAFSAANKEPPAYTIQKSMKSVMKKRGIENEVETKTDEIQRTSLPTHIPNFIRISQDLPDYHSEEQQNETEVLKRRRDILNTDEENLALIKERAKNPTDLKWQVCPLIEARIFHCVKN